MMEDSKKEKIITDERVQQRLPEEELNNVTGGRTRGPIGDYLPQKRKQVGEKTVN